MSFNSANTKPIVPLTGTAPTVGIIDQDQFRTWANARNLLGCGQLGTSRAQRHPRCNFMYASDEAENADRTMIVFGLRPILGESVDDVQGYELVKLWTIVWTIGAKVGDADVAALPATLRLADACVDTTTDAYLTFLNSLFSSTKAVHSPGSDLVAHAGIADLGNLSHLLFHVASYAGGGSHRVYAEVLS